VLEEYALDRLDARKAGAVEHHVRTCGNCRESVAAFRAEGDLLTAALAAQQSVTLGDCLDNELLAQYVDATLSPDERAEAEEHLAACRPCQRRLVALYRELKALQDEEKALQAPGEAARYESDEPATPVSAPDLLVSNAPTEAIQAVASPAPKLRLGIALLSVGGVCAVAAGLWPWAGIGAVRLVAALVMASGVALISQWRSIHAPTQGGTSGFGRAHPIVLAIMAGCFAGVASGGFAPTFTWWSAAVVSFGLWLVETSAAQRNARKEEILERHPSVSEAEERKERSM
jgi:anti-sigma factor RsiW